MRGHNALADVDVRIDSDSVKGCAKAVGYECIVLVAVLSSNRGMVTENE